MLRSFLLIQLLLYELLFCSDSLKSTKYCNWYVLYGAFTTHPIEALT